MPSRKFPNYLRTIRKRSGLSQDEVAFLIGGHSGGKVSRYEHFNRVPSLQTACAYEVIFGVPVSQLFAGMFEKVRRSTARRAYMLTKKIGNIDLVKTGARKIEKLMAIASDATGIQQPQKL